MNHGRNEGQAIVEFYRGRATDDAGRYLSSVLAWPDELLELHHDFIQWLFPLLERSRANPSAPVLDQAAIATFKGDAALRDTLRQSLVRMLAFYGLSLDDCSPPTISRAADFPVRSRDWLTAGNHNHLRLTRILTSLRLLGLNAEAQALFRILKEIYEEELRKPNPGISTTSFKFWTAAAVQSLRE